MPVLREVLIRKKNMFGGNFEKEMSSAPLLHCNPLKPLPPFLDLFNFFKNKLLL